MHTFKHVTPPALAGTEQQYYSQQMLTAYKGKSGYGNAVAKPNFAWDAAVTAGIQGVTALTGLVVQGSQGKKEQQRALEALTAQSEIAAMEAQAVQVESQAAMQRAQTYALYGAGTLIALGLIGAVVYTMTHKD